MDHSLLLSVGFPVAHFVDETFPRLHHTFLQLRESMETQLIEIIGTRGFRAVVGMARG